MLKTFFLICLALALVAFLLWRRTPRPIFFEAALNSVWIFAIAYWLTENLIYKLKPDLLDGFIPYLPPIVPVVVFLAWFLSRAKVIKR